MYPRAHTWMAHTCHMHAYTQSHIHTHTFLMVHCHVGDKSHTLTTPPKPFLSPAHRFLCQLTTPPKPFLSPPLISRQYECIHHCTVPATNLLRDMPGPPHFMPLHRRLFHPDLLQRKRENERRARQQNHRLPHHPCVPGLPEPRPSFPLPVPFSPVR